MSGRPGSRDFSNECDREGKGREIKPVGRGCRALVGSTFVPSGAGPGREGPVQDSFGRVKGH